MHITVVYDEERNIVVTTVSAPITNANIRRTIEETVQVAQRHGCRNLLFDIRRCTLQQSLMEAFKGVEDIRHTLGLDVEYKSAVVFDPGTYPVERAMFIENVIANRPNPLVRMFIDLQQASEWLKNLQAKK